MLEILTEFLVWGGFATGIALAAVAVYLVRSRGLPGAVLAAAGSHLFLGICFALLGTGHLVAVTTGGFLDTLSEHLHLGFLIPFGLAMVLPGCILIANVPGIHSGRPKSRRAAAACDLWLTALLLAASPYLAPFPALGLLSLAPLKRL